MQLIINISKYLAMAILCCSLMFTWYGSENDVTRLTLGNQTALGYQSDNDDFESSIWESMAREFKLDDRAQSARVQAEIHDLLSDQDKLYEILQAAGPYIYFIHDQIKARGLPAEIALIPVIESEFNPNNRSKVGAAGLWQLMTETAHELGIKVKSGYDGRRNVVASTKAALAYFKDLGNDFKGNWYLAIAAYNCGQVRVESAIRKTGIGSFWDLPLPKETRSYVPRLLAVAAIIKDPKKYGVELPPISNKPYFTALKVQGNVDLTQVSKSAGVSMDTLSKLNPDYTHGSHPKTETETLLVPVAKAPVVAAKLNKTSVTASVTT